MSGASRVFQLLLDRHHPQLPPGSPEYERAVQLGLPVDGSVPWTPTVGSIPLPADATFGDYAQAALERLKVGDAVTASAIDAVVAELAPLQTQVRERTAECPHIGAGRQITSGCLARRLVVKRIASGGAVLGAARAAGGGGGVDGAAGQVDVHARVRLYNGGRAALRPDHLAA